MVANNAEQKRKREAIELEDMNAKCGLNFKQKHPNRPKAHFNRI